MPNQPQPMPSPPMGGQSPMGGGAPAAGGQPEMEQGQVVEAIKQVIQRIKSLADQHGIDLMALISDEMGAGGGQKPPSMPPPPPM